MPQLRFTLNRRDDLSWIIAQMLADQGVAVVTMRNIARCAHMSTSSIVHHWDDKERLLQIAMACTVRWRRTDTSFRAIGQGAAAFLPDDAPDSYGRIQDSLVLARAWLGWRELWRTYPSLEKIGAHARSQERWDLGRLLQDPTEAQLDAAYALVEGLVVAMCAPVAPMPRSHAVAILEDHLAPLLGDRDPQA
jgi:AcrR family transcriptional regulator